MFHVNIIIYYTIVIRYINVKIINLLPSRPRQVNDNIILIQQLRLRIKKNCKNLLCACVY